VVGRYLGYKNADIRFPHRFNDPYLIGLCNLYIERRSKKILNRINEITDFLLYSQFNKEGLCKYLNLKFLLSEEAITEYGILRLIRQNGVGGMALAEIIQPGITMEIGSSEKIEEVAEIKELFPVEILKMLPEAESSFPGMNGWVHQGEKTQVVFWYSKEGCICEEHSHPYPEWE